MGMYGSPMRVRLRRNRPRVAAVLVVVAVGVARTGRAGGVEARGD